MISSTWKNRAKLLGVGMLAVVTVAIVYIEITEPLSSPWSMLPSPAGWAIAVVMLGGSFALFMSYDFRRRDIADECRLRKEHLGHQPTNPS